MPTYRYPTKSPKHSPRPADRRLTAHQWVTYYLSTTGFSTASTARWSLYANHLQDKLTGVKLDELTGHFVLTMLDRLPAEHRTEAKALLCKALDAALSAGEIETSPANYLRADHLQ